MEWHLEQDGKLLIAHAVGELNAQTADAFTEMLDDRVSGEDAAVAIDLSEVISVDSTGLSALVRLATKARLSRGWVVLINPTPLVRGVLRVTRLDGWFDVCESVEEARERLSQG